MAKVGRKTKPYRTSWGETIDGLYRLPDKRWRITETGQRFTQPDERLAVLHFRQLERSKARHAVKLSVPLASPDAMTVYRTLADAGESFTIRGTEPGEVSAISKMVPEPMLWAWFRQQMIERPKYAAQQTGIEQLGYLADLPKPTPSPTLDEVGNLYFDRAKITDHWRTKSRLFWEEFSDSVDVRTLREVTQEKVADYKADVLEAPPSPTYVKHRFGQVKTIIAYSKEWGKWAEDRTRVLAYCSILKPPESASLDPQPIDRSHFHAVLAAADDKMQAILLLALNACMYGSEVADLKWADLNLDTGVVIADRGKTKVPRVAVLWPRTVDALRKLPHVTDSIFLTDATKMPHNANTIGKVFRRLRTAADVPDAVKFMQIRDGAYTAACEGKAVQYQHAIILSGQRVPGCSDMYVKRRPSIVADACAAVEAAYFG
ncbi:MAG: Phage integrase family protein [Phycisphaerales bacterium]|nr:Phage integrase family protein [Phycisphaerales bacterium]